MSATTTPDAVSQNGERRSGSFGFMRRQKSTETANRPTIKSKKGKGKGDLQARPSSTKPPQLPTLPSDPLPTIAHSFGGDNSRSDSFHFGNNQHDNQQPQNGQQYPNQNQLQQVYAQAGIHAMPMQSSYQQSHLSSPMPSSSPASRNGGDYVDPYARTESMTHRGRYSYASSAISASGINSPRRVRRRKDPTPFNILVIGEQNSGKTSFIEFLRNALASSNKKRQATQSPPQTALPGDSPFTPHYLETDVDHERIGVTLWDSQGLEKKFVDLQLREMSSFLESKFEETFTEEQKVVRAPGVRDTHIHCIFLILDPSRLDSNLAYAKKGRQPLLKFDEAVRLMGVLDEDLDIQILRTLQGKTTVIPVISKADTITTANMALLKRAVWDSLKEAKLDPLKALNINDDEDDEEKTFDERDEDAYVQSGDEDNDHSDLINNLIDRSSEDGHEAPMSTPPTSPMRAEKEKSHRRSISGTLTATANDEVPFLPLSIISPDTYEQGLVGRRFPWGFADPYNQEHCDFVRLKDAVFSEWRGELREASREVWYEGWRTSRLKRRERAPSSATTRAVSGTQYRTSPAPVQLPDPSSPEMIRGAYKQGVNAF